MINKDKVSELMAGRNSIEYYDEFRITEYRENLIRLLGDDKGEVIDFINSADEDTLFALDEIYEELIEKFGEDIETVWIKDH